MADQAEIFEEIEALAVHCRPSLMTVEARALWVRDWCEDLAEFPIEHIRLACRQWRQGGKTKFPTPGELLPLVRSQAKTKPDLRSPADEPWKPLSDWEFDRLTLAEKVRHHRILAHEARRKAGPMWANGRPVSADEMPDRWREWSARADNHDAEAMRLGAIIRDAQRQAAE